MVPLLCCSLRHRYNLGLSHSYAAGNRGSLAESYASLQVDLQPRATAESRAATLGTERERQMNSKLRLALGWGLAIFAALFLAAYVARWFALWLFSEASR